MICPFMSFHGNDGLKECEKGNCALYNEPFDMCIFCLNVAALSSLADTFDQITYTTFSGTKGIRINK